MRKCICLFMASLEIVMNFPHFFSTGQATTTEDGAGGTASSAERGRGAHCTGSQSWNGHTLLTLGMQQGQQ